MKLSDTKATELLEKSKGLFLNRKDRRIQTLAITFVLLFIIPIYLLALWVLPVSITGLLKFGLFILLVGLVGILAYFVISKRIPLSDRNCHELASLENEIENDSYETITKLLGNKIYRELNPTLSSIDVYQTSLCKELLNQSDINNNNLRFHLYLKLYKFYYMSESFNNALNAISKALEIYPNKLIIKIWLAEAYEYTANGKKAIDEYESILKLKSISYDIKYYIERQVERIKLEGPRKAAPVTGLRYMSY